MIAVIEEQRNKTMERANNQGCQMVGMLDIKGQDQCRRVYSVNGIAPTLTTSGGGAKGSENI